VTRAALASRCARGLLAISLLAGCAVPAADGADPSGVAQGSLVPDQAGFRALHDALMPNCATLDCHGDEARNLRLYGGRGLRLDPEANPADGSTTEREYAASYRAIALLEPDALSAVLRDHGRNPERLSLVRKPRGLERHGGHTVMVPRDDLDRCVTSWLASRTDTAACSRAKLTTLPAPEDERN
jgi:hypothetical protein